MAAQPARETVKRLDPDTPKTMRQAAFEDRFLTTLFGTVFSTFAVIALVLAAVGIYRVISYSVARRTQEIGVRLALGASRQRVLGMLLGQALFQLILGLSLGLPAALFISRGLGAVLFQVDPADPSVYPLVVLLLSAVATLASCFPAQRAV